MLKRIDNYITNMSDLKQVILVYILTWICPLLVYNIMKSTLSSIIAYLLFILFVIYLTTRKGTIEDLGIKKPSKRILGEMIIVIIVGVIYKIRFHRTDRAHPLFILFYQMCFVAPGEEIIFRGFIGRKLPIKNRVIRYVIAGVLFSFVHLPMYLNMGYDQGLALFQQNFMMHVLVTIQYQIIYDYFNSFIPTTIFHGLGNWW